MQLTEDERGIVQGGSSMDTASNNYQSSAEHAKLASDLKAYEEVRNSSNMSIIGITKVTDVVAQ